MKITNKKINNIKNNMILKNNNIQTKFNNYKKRFNKFIYKMDY